MYQKEYRNNLALSYEYNDTSNQIKTNSLYWQGSGNLLA
jgi:hypothetical protein